MEGSPETFRSWSCATQSPTGTSNDGCSAFRRCRRDFDSTGWCRPQPEILPKSIMIVATSVEIAILRQPLRIPCARSPTPVCPRRSTGTRSPTVSQPTLPY
jgi:hypothetical protein